MNILQSISCFDGDAEDDDNDDGDEENLKAAQCMGAQPQWREFPRLTSAPFSSRSLIIERCCSITYDYGGDAYIQESGLLQL